MSYTFPPLSLLNTPDLAAEVQRKEFAEYLNRKLKEVLAAFKVNAKITSHTYNDFAVVFHIKMGAGEKVKKLLSLREDIELHIGLTVEMALSKRGYVIMAAKSATRPVLTIRKVMESPAFWSHKSPLAIAAGVDLLAGEFVIDLKKLNNLLVVGTTGSGKSTFLNSMIVSFLYRSGPEDLQLLLIDPKAVEFQAFNGMPQMLTDIVTEPEKALMALQWALDESRKRSLEIRNAKCHSLDQYQAATDKKMPRIVIIIDEYMELIFRAGKELEALVRQITSLAATTGVHLVLATQRPSKDVVSPPIKANIPARAAFTVVDKRESQIAIHRFGAERLLGNGDMIFTEDGNSEAVHVQGAYVSYEEIDRIIDFIKANNNDE